MLIEPSSNSHKRKYAFISDPSDPETPQPTLKKLKLDTLKAIWQDFNLPPTKDLGFKSLITKFEQVFQSAKALHEFLEDNKYLLQPNTLISIPSLFLSSNALQDKRFPNITQFVDMAVTESMKKTVQELLKSSRLNLYLRGPTGYGKSYLMALYTLLLRQRKEYRVLYVNNPEKCHEDFGRYIANEFVYCFYRDFAARDMPLPPEESAGNTPLEKWYNYLIHYKTDVKEISIAFKKLMRWSEEKENPLIFVLDQMEVVSRCSGSREYKSFAKNFYHVFQKSNCHRRVASALANDDTFKYHDRHSIKDIQKLFKESDVIQHLYWLLNHKISPEEIATMNLENDGILRIGESQEKKPFDIDFPFVQDANILKILPDWKKDEKYEKLLAILKVTGDSPYELSKVIDCITSNKKDSFEDILEDCFAKSVAEYKNLHSQYRNAIEHSQELKTRLFQTIITVDSEGDCEGICGDYDRNLIYAVKESWESKFYTICPAVAKTLAKYYAEDFAFNEHILDQSHRFEIQNALYAIDDHKKDSTLAKSAIHEFRTWRTPRSLNYYFFDDQNQQKKDTMNVFIKRFEYFDTKKLEKDILKVIENRFGTRQKLFVANSPNYRLVDCVLLDHLHKDDPTAEGRHRIIIYLIKITTCVNEHEKVDKIIKSDEESLFGCKHDICKVMKELKNEFLNRPDYELKFRFVWYTMDYLVQEIDFTKIHKDSWIVGAKIFTSDE